MDQLLPLASGASKAATTATPFFLALDHTVAMSISPPEEAPVPAPPSPASDPSRHSNHQRGSETIKAKIMSHPLYPALLRAFIDCRKVGAPPEVAGRLSSLASNLESNSDDMQEQLIDPELDQFMETYCHMLVMYSQELTRQIQEADGFFRSMEAHIDSLALGEPCPVDEPFLKLLHVEITPEKGLVDTCCSSLQPTNTWQNDKCGGSSSEDEPETGDDVAVLPAISSTRPSGEDKELKSQLLDKYSGSGYLSSLWMELSRKKRRGKLPRDARLKLLRWWQLHYRWPYPSELEKVELSESTGLDAKQINNWFINQRKRHWKPPTPVPAGDHYRLQHADGASSSSSAAFCVEGHCFTGGSGYPRGGP